MFAKRQKKNFPPGTFIPTPARVCAIIQLCLAFTVLLWNLAKPFTEDLFIIKSKLVVFEDVKGVVNSSTSTSTAIARLQRNAERFHQLPKEQQEQINRGMTHLQKELQRSFFDKCFQSIHTLLFEIPFFERLWLLLSLILPMMALKRVEGAAHAVWLLPLLAMAYTIDNRYYGTLSTPSEEQKLFPTEAVLLEDYLHEPLSSNIFDQKEQLERAWQLYLMNEWAHRFRETASMDQPMMVEEGEFAFNTARALALSKIPPLHSPARQQQEPLPLLLTYFLWNLFFAYTQATSKIENSHTNDSKSAINSAR